MCVCVCRYTNEFEINLRNLRKILNLSSVSVKKNKAITRFVRLSTLPLIGGGQHTLILDVFEMKVNVFWFFSVCDTTLSRCP